MFSKPFINKLNHLACLELKPLKIRIGDSVPKSELLFSKKNKNNNCFLHDLKFASV